MRYVAAVLLLAGSTYGQASKPPALAQAPAPAPAPITGKSTLSGIVINAKTHEPVKKASVMINGGTNLSAVTDAGGNFSFRSLPAGAYWVMANQPDFFVSRRRGQMALNVTLAEGEEKTGVEIALQPGASIGGRVVNEDDQPVPRCSVSAVRVGEKRAPLVSPFAITSNTDPDGNYRIHGIAAGRYAVRVRCSASFPAPHGFMRVNDPEIPTEGYAPATSYGGLLLEAGADVGGLDFHVQRSRMFTVRATVSGLDSNLLPNTQLFMASKDSQQDDDVGMPAHYNGRRGLFVFRNVTPGSYELTAMLLQGDKAFEARQDVQVGNTPVTDVELKMTAGPSITGTVVADDAAIQLEGQQISLQALQANYRGPFPTATLTKDGTFDFKSILPGHFSLNGLQGGFFKSVTLGGREVSPFDFEISGEGGGVLHISLSSRFGKVHVGADTPSTAGAQLAAALLPVGGGPPIINGTAGGGPVNVQFDAVPPGKYHLLLVDSENPWMIVNDTAAQKALEDHMTQVTVIEAGEQRITGVIVGKEELDKLLDTSE